MQLMQVPHQLLFE